MRNHWTALWSRRCWLSKIVLSMENHVNITSVVILSTELQGFFASWWKFVTSRMRLLFIQLWYLDFALQPKWNNALLEMFRIDYVGTSPYITCNPSLYHHKLGPKDRFLILSSDGLYQYFTNEEAVAQVEMFIAATPEGDPAQHLAEEVLIRAAKRAGKFQILNNTIDIVWMLNLS